MQFDSFCTLSPLINEIKNEYLKYRREGNSPNHAIERIKIMYADEIKDEDDAQFVQIAIGLALYSNNELTQNVLSESQNSLDKLCMRDDMQPYFHILKQVREYLDANGRPEDRVSNLEVEPSLKRNTTAEALNRYNPCWKIGDTFAHKLTFPRAKKFGLEEWYVIFRKVGEFTDLFSKQRQLVYVTLCPPDRLPKNEKELTDLGYLIMRPHDSANEYLAQIIIKSKADEKKYELIKIGSYPNAGHPISQAEVNPLILTVILGKIKLSDPWVPYEETVCFRYKDFGISEAIQ